MVFNFPELQEMIGGVDGINMQLIVDNSYNSTTGLRYEIGAFRLVCSNGLIIGEKYGTYYHKHTRGIQPEQINSIIMKGCDVFKTKIVDKFNRMVQTEITPNIAISFFENCIEKKVIAIKYLEMMKERAEYENGIDGVPITNEWLLYNVITEVLTHHVQSIDARRRYNLELMKKMRRAAWAI